MLRSKLLHPEILAVLGTCGHGSKILIADGNYAFSTRSNPAAKKVYLNLMPGTVKVTEILESLVDMIAIESAAVMEVPGGIVPDIHVEYKKMLPKELELTYLERYAFYDAVKSQDTALVIASGDQRRFANLLITLAAVKSGLENF